MNKTDRQYLENRIDNIVRCTNGHITDIIKKQKKDIGLSKEIKYQMIVNKKALLKSEHELVKIKASYNVSIFESLLECYDYSKSAIQKKNILFNESLDNRITDLMQEVTLAGKRLVDRMVLGLVDKEAIPVEMETLNKMISLAK